MHGSIVSYSELHHFAEERTLLVYPKYLSFLGFFSFSSGYLAWQGCYAAYDKSSFTTLMDNTMDSIVKTSSLSSNSPKLLSRATSGTEFLVLFNTQTLPCSFYFFIHFFLVLQVEWQYTYPACQSNSIDWPDNCCYPQFCQSSFPGFSVLKISTFGANNIIFASLL